MKVFMTGATGFIGGRVAAKLRERGDQVVALVRAPEQAGALGELGCELVRGTLSDATAIRTGLEECDAAIHCAAIYEIGIPQSQRPAMYEANVLGTERVLRAALEAGIPRVVYVSTIAAFGDTGGRVVDETYHHPGVSFTSYYEETKYKAHQIAIRLIEDEALPAILVQPGAVYGPGDQSQLGDLIDQYLTGKLPLIPFGDLGLNVVHVDDVADGILLALDDGELGQAYVLGGAITTNREMLQTAALLAGEDRSARGLPTAALRAIAPLGPLIGPLAGLPPNIGELIDSSEGVTFWAKHDKAIEALGYSPRGLESTLRDTFVADGRLSA
jgi:nucleoside-diphosphate-sugar epimerase